jgi:hypothetical protein
MKWLCIILLFFSADSFSQCKTYLLTGKGDTINCTDVNGKKRGMWLVKVAELRGNPGYEEEGMFVNDQKEGTWYQYTTMGDLKAVENYKYGVKDGISRYYGQNEALVREESWKAVNPENPYDTVDVQDLYDPNKTNKVIVKLEGRSVKHGTWKYYNEYTGALVRTDKYMHNKLEDPNAKKSDLVDAGTTSDSTKPAPPKVKPKEVMDFEKKNEGKKKVKVRDGRTGG